MRVLVLGGGGREHALAWGLERADSVDEVFVGPGNPGTATVATNIALDTVNPEAVLQVAREKAIDLVVIGPEAPLVAGVADAVRRRGIAVIDPRLHQARTVSLIVQIDHHRARGDNRAARIDLMNAIKAAPGLPAARIAQARVFLSLFDAAGAPMSPTTR